MMPKRVAAFLECLAVLSFGLTLFLLWSDKTASAGVAVALSFGALLFRVLPDLESFEILGLKAKLRERLQEADRILGMLRDLASTTAKASVLNTSWSNRIGGLRYAQQSELLDQQARLLEDLGVDPAAIREVKKPALSMFSRDVASFFQSAVSAAARKYREHYQSLLTELGQPCPEPEKEKERQRKLRIAQNRVTSYDEKVATSFIEQLPNRALPLGDHLQQLIESFRWSAKDREALRSYAERLSTVDAFNWNTWRLGPEVQAFLEERKYPFDATKEAFPDGISGPDWDVREE